MTKLSKGYLVLCLTVFGLLTGLAVLAAPSFEVAQSAPPRVWNFSVTTPVLPNTPTTITVNAFDISGVASVQAYIMKGTSEIALVTLFDDGGHHDGEPGDMTYGDQWNVPAGATGTYTVEIQANDTLGNATARQNLGSFSIDERVPTVTSSGSATGWINQNFSYQITAAPGPITGYGVTGTLPNGVSLNSSTGVISGTATAEGTFNVNITASNGNGTSAPLPLSIVINHYGGLATIFVTSTTTTGDINGPGNTHGLDGADALCQDRVTQADPGGTVFAQGTWRAWLSSTSADAADRLSHNSAPYAKAGGELVANDWAGLVSGTLINPINIDEFGQPVSNAAVWTGSNFSGRLANISSCVTSNLSWAAGVAFPSFQGGIGNTGATNNGWTYPGQQGNASCASLNRLYCLWQEGSQQPQQISSINFSLGQIVNSVFTPLDPVITTDTVTVAAQAVTPIGATLLSRFYLDGGQGVDQPFTSNPDINIYWSQYVYTLSNGPHIIRARLFDPANYDPNNPTTYKDAEVSVNVNISLPTASISYPVNGQTVAGVETVLINASFTSAIDRLELYDANTTYIGSLVPPPNSNTLINEPITWDTRTGFFDGAHNIYAYACSGTLCGFSPQVLVHVDNQPPAIIFTPTLINALSKLGGSVGGGINSQYPSKPDGTVVIDVDARDSGTGIDHVEYFLDGVSQGSVNTAPFTWVWNSDLAAIGKHAITARAFDRTGKSTPTTAQLDIILDHCAFCVGGCDYKVNECCLKGENVCLPIGKCP